MKSLQIALLILFFCAVTSTAQNTKPCSPALLTAKIHGFSLGMTKTAVVNAVPGIQPRAQSDGTDIAIHTNFTDTNRFDGVRQMDFHFFQNILYRIAVHYNEASMNADNLMAFANNFSKSWKIKEQWSEGNLNSHIECRQRTALANSNGSKSFSLTLTDNLAVERINKARK